MKRTQLVGYLDDQGELHEGVPVLCNKKVQSPYGSAWMQINQDFLRELAARKDVTGEVLRVFLYLNSRLDFENIIRVPQVEIAKALGLQPQNVHRAIKKLVEIGVLIPGPIASSWRLNPHAGWKGKVTHLRQAHRDQTDRILKSVK